MLSLLNNVSCFFVTGKELLSSLLLPRSANEFRKPDFGCRYWTGCGCVKDVTIKPALHGMRKRCCVKNCRNHMALQRVPPYPKDIPSRFISAMVTTQPQWWEKDMQRWSPLGRCLSGGGENGKVARRCRQNRDITLLCTPFRPFQGFWQTQF